MTESVKSVEPVNLTIAASLHTNTIITWQIDLEFEPVDYDNYEYAELGVLDFSKPPAAAAPERRRRKKRPHNTSLAKRKVR